MLFKYLDLPPIPEELLPSKKEIIGLPIKDNYGAGSFVNKYCSIELEEYVKTQFNFKITVYFQIILGNLVIHKDRDRNYCINYILHQGNVDTTTNFYDDEEKIIFSEIIKPKTWHAFSVNTNHNVTNNKNNIRIAIGCTPHNDCEYLDNLFNIKNIIS